MKKILFILLCLCIQQTAKSQCGSALISATGTPGTYCSGDPFVINLAGDVAGTGESFVAGFVSSDGTGTITAFSTIAAEGFATFNDAWLAPAFPWGDNAGFVYDAVAGTLSGTLPTNTTGAAITITYYVSAQDDPIDFTTTPGCPAFTVTVTVGAAGVGACPGPPPPPSNDNICSATSLTVDATVGDDGVSGDNTSASVQTAEGTSISSTGGACSAPNNTIWYTYTPAATGLYAFSIGSVTGGGLWVSGYTVTGCPTTPVLTDVPAADCAAIGGFNAAGTSPSFSLNGGTQYYFQIDGVSGAFGPFTDLELNSIVSVPCSAITAGVTTPSTTPSGTIINCDDIILFGDTLATIPNSPAPGNISGVNFLVSTAPITGFAPANLVSVIAGLEGQPGGTTIALPNDGSLITTSGTYYFTAIISGNYTPSTTVPGTGVYDPACSLLGPSISVVVNLNPPTNDICSGATALALGTTLASSNGCATIAGPTDSIGVGTCAFAGGATSSSVWYSFAAATAGDYEIAVTNAPDVVIGLYSGCPGSAGATLLGCTDDFAVGGETDTVTIATPGTYYVVVQGWDAAAVGTFDIAVSLLGALPCTGVPNVTATPSPICSDGIFDFRALTFNTAGSNNGGAGSAYNDFNAATGTGVLPIYVLIATADTGLVGPADDIITGLTQDPINGPDGLILGLELGVNIPSFTPAFPLIDTIDAAASLINNTCVPKTYKFYLALIGAGFNAGNFNGIVVDPACEVYDSVNVTVYPKPTAGTHFTLPAAGTCNPITPICTGMTIQYATAAGGPYGAFPTAPVSGNIFYQINFPGAPGSCQTAGSYTLTCTPACTANSGTLINTAPTPCLPSTGDVTISATSAATTVPAGSNLAYVLTDNSPALTILQAPSATPSFTVIASGNYVIHAIVFDPADLAACGGAPTGGSSAATLVSCLTTNGACFDLTSAAPQTVAVCPTFWASADPCVCNNDATLANGSNGTFNETISIFNDLNGNGAVDAGEGLPIGQAASITIASVPVGAGTGTVPAVGATPTEVAAPGGGSYYEYNFNFVSGTDYSVTINTPGGVLSQSNYCGYPSAAIAPVGPFDNCAGQPATALTAASTNPSSGGTFAWTGTGVTGSNFNPSGLGVGAYSIGLTYTGTAIAGGIGAGIGTSAAQAYPGCQVASTTSVTINACCLADAGSIAAPATVCGNSVTVTVTSPETVPAGSSLVYILTSAGNVAYTSNSSTFVGVLPGTYTAHALVSTSASLASAPCGPVVVGTNAGTFLACLSANAICHDIFSSATTTVVAAAPVVSSGGICLDATTTYDLTNSTTGTGTYTLLSAGSTGAVVTGSTITALIPGSATVTFTPTGSTCSATINVGVILDCTACAPDNGAWD